MARVLGNARAWQLVVTVMLPMLFGGCDTYLLSVSKPVAVPEPNADRAAWASAYPDYVYVSLKSSVLPPEGQQNAQFICSSQAIWSNLVSNEKKFLISASPVVTPPVTIPVFSVQDAGGCTTNDADRQLLPKLRLGNDGVQINGEIFVSNKTNVDLRRIGELTGTLASFFTSGGSVVVTTLSTIANDERSRQLNQELNSQLARKDIASTTFLTITPSQIQNLQFSFHSDVYARKQDDPADKAFKVARIVFSITPTKSIFTNTILANGAPNYQIVDVFNNDWAIGHGGPGKITAKAAQHYERMMPDLAALNKNSRPADYIALCDRISEALLRLGLGYFDIAYIKQQLLYREAPAWHSKEDFVTTLGTRCFGDAERTALELIGLPHSPKPEVVSVPTST